MKSPVEDKSCYSQGPTQEISSGSSIGFEFHRANGTNRASHHHRTALGKPTPSKWDDAQKWLVGISRVGGDKNQSKTKPRNSNADDRRLIAPVPPEQEYSSDEDGCGLEQNEGSDHAMAGQYEVETKKVDCDESVWRINKSAQNCMPAVRSVCVRDMGTDMTPIASQEPSRTATPIRATTPATRSPINSGSSTPVTGRHGVTLMEGRGGVAPFANGPRVIGACMEGAHACELSGNMSFDQAKKLSPLESRAMAWDEAERAKYMARYKREEVKIQAWENHEKRKAEMQMKKMEVKAERLKARAQEKLTNKLASTRRIAEEKRANAEAKLNEKAVRTSERADYIRRTGHLPLSFSLKLPSLCW
ncbi:hypothetical protein BT93_B2938 [Corymbia citriodora subsp. variegata]|nr:hypothetical protein BT93_B2938 [Corymbia citriodora subsp. variegata]